MKKAILVALLGTAMSATAMAQEEMVKPSSAITGKNVLAIAPLQITERGIGVGLSYERVLDNNGMVSLYIPAVYTFSNENNYDGSNNNDYSVQVMPGIKIYPTGYNGVIRYSVGPSIYFAYGEENYTNYAYSPYYYSNGQYYTTAPQYYETNNEHVTLGMLVNNTLNINPTPHLFMALELGLGVSYLNRINGIGDGTQALVQFGFKLGYRF